ncbi:MAG: insulinase family protein [Cytophagales bacterium]|nr:insulinase family protein [Armatimonadota bacterium]
MKRPLLVTSLLLLAAPLPAQDVSAPAPTLQQTPPPPAAPKTLVVPALAEKTLPNGIRVIVAPRTGTGLVSVQMLVRGAGGSADPGNKAGLADLTASLIGKGTTTRTAPQIATAIETLGGSLSAGAGWDAAIVNLSVMRARLPAAFPLFADSVLRPRFAPDELNRLRSQTLDALAVNLEEPGTLARYAAARITFGTSPYAHPLGGTLTSLKRIERADIQDFFLTSYQPGRTLLVFGGDITPGDAYTLAEKFLGGWKAVPNPSGREIARQGRTAPPYPARRIVVMDKPDAGQAAVVITRLGIKRNDADFYTAEVMNSVLGGGFSSRLNREIRIKRGLSYGANSAVSERLDPGPFVASAQTKNESAPEVAQLLLDELDRIATGDLPDVELTPRKLALIGDFNRALETGGGLSGQAASLALYGVPLGDLAEYPNRVRAVAAGDIQKFAGSRLAAKDTSVVIVGNARLFLEALKKQFPASTVEVIPVSRLDFDSPTLIRR